MMGLPMRSCKTKRWGSAPNEALMSRAVRPKFTDVQPNPKPHWMNSTNMRWYRAWDLLWLPSNPTKNASTSRPSVRPQWKPMICPSNLATHT